MRLAPADAGGERYAVVNHDLGIVPIEFLGDGDEGSLAVVYHVFRRLDLSSSATSEDDRLAAAFSAWQEVLAPSGIGLRLEREALYGPPLPRTRVAGDSRGISLRPWDIELTAIEARLRRVVKLDQVPSAFVESLRQKVEERGLLVEAVTPQDPDGSDATTLIVARDAPTVTEARDLEQRLLVPGSAQGADGAASKMGELLGYPPCCVNRFARVAEHNDTNLAWALLPGTLEPASPFTQWLQPGLALVSHSPCDLNCAASIEVGQRLLNALDAVEPGFAAGWRALAARIQVVDQRGNRIALAIDGPLTATCRVAAADLLASGGPDPDAEERARGLVGREVRARLGGLVIPDRDWYAPYVADHRAG